MAPIADRTAAAATDHATGNGRARPLSEAERRERSAHLVGVLARALTAQFDELARTGGPAPEGWWFVDGVPNADGTAGQDGSHGAHAAADGAEEDR